MKSVIVVARILVASMLVVFVGSATGQQLYPNKLIRIITPYPPGGATTPLAHFLGQKMTDSWGQPFVVDNRPGGNTIIGTDALAKSPPDGHTIMLASSAHVLVPLLMKVPYDPIKDFAPVATFTRSTYVLIINPAIPVNNLSEFIAYAKARPGQLNYGTPGAGGPQHLAHELLNQTAEIKTQHVPYKGSTQLFTDLIGGRVQMFLATTNTSLPQIKAGKVKPIAIASDTRLPILPQVPTFAEAGLPDFKVGTWYGILAPAGTPKEIIDQLSTAIGKYIAMPDFKEMLANQGMSPFYSNAEQLAGHLIADRTRFMNIIKAGNIKFEN